MSHPVGLFPKAKNPHRAGSRRVLHLITSCLGGGGGNRTRVQEYSTDSSTYLVLPFNLIRPTRTHTLWQDESPWI
jgi:hypothetical protein